MGTWLLAAAGPVGLLLFFGWQDHRYGSQSHNPHLKSAVRASAVVGGLLWTLAIHTMHPQWPGITLCLLLVAIGVIARGLRFRGI